MTVVYAMPMPLQLLHMGGATFDNGLLHVDGKSGPFLPDISTSVIVLMQILVCRLVLLPV